MATFLKLDKKLYSPLTGLVPLRRGDTWNLFGVIVEKYAAYEKPLSLSDVDSASGFFENATGGTLVKAVTIANAAGGQVEIEVPGSETIDVAESPEGVGMYVVLNRAGEEETVETYDQPLEVKDRGDSNS